MMANRNSTRPPDSVGIPTDDGLDTLLETDAPGPSAGFDDRFWARFDPARHAETLDDLLDVDAPRPRDAFDAQFASRWETERCQPPAPDLDALLDLDHPAPRAGFDARFQARLTQASRTPAADSTPVAASPTRSAEVIPMARPQAVRTGHSRHRRWPRWLAALPALAAAAVLALFVGQDFRGDEPDAADLAMMAELELLEVYGEMQLFDALEDEETFEVVAMLHVLDEEATP